MSSFMWNIVKALFTMPIIYAAQPLTISKVLAIVACLIVLNVSSVMGFIKYMEEQNG